VDLCTHYATISVTLETIAHSLFDNSKISAPNLPRRPFTASVAESVRAFGNSEKRQSFGPPRVLERQYSLGLVEHGAQLSLVLSSNLRYGASQ
jgi:hypothetical protein